MYRMQRKMNASLGRLQKLPISLSVQCVGESEYPYLIFVYLVLVPVFYWQPVVFTFLILIIVVICELFALKICFSTRLLINLSPKTSCFGTGYSILLGEYFLLKKRFIGGTWNRNCHPDLLRIWKIFSNSAIMGLAELSFCLLLLSLSGSNAKTTCDYQYFLAPLTKNTVQTKLLDSSDCGQIGFEGSDKLNSHLGSLRLRAALDDKRGYSLDIIFREIKWNKAHLRLSQENEMDLSICKVYSRAHDAAQVSISEAIDSCFNFEHYNSSVNYLLDFMAELDTDILYKNLVFNFPNVANFGNDTPLQNRAIFCSVDISSNYDIYLNIQALPLMYNVTYYKVEVFKIKGGSNILLDVRMLKAGLEPELSFEFITYNDEGYYFFQISAVNDICPEDACLKSISATIYIRRRYPPLVIGIVGASFLIPCILFMFHMWNRRNQPVDKNEEAQSTIYLVYSQTPEKHYLIVKALEKSLKNLAKVQIVSNISEASHIIYICGTHIFQPDPIVHKHLVIEANRAISSVEILVVCLPYSTKEMPPYLKKCLRFNLMEDFEKLIHLFCCDVDFSSHTQYGELDAQVKAAQIHTEPKKIILNMPVIIVTEQSDTEPEPKEADVLL
uniref:SEFIR domain-containing protein n=1 Tax=Dendroctonus ponderosae TaxID=77166 RepID=A0AAR5PCC8_DENPD